LSASVVAFPDARALYQAVSFPLLSLKGAKYHGPIVHWFVIERPRPLDLEELIQLDGATGHNAAIGSGATPGSVDRLRSIVAQSLTSSEVRDLRAYLAHHYRCGLYTQPVPVPVERPLTDEVPALPSAIAERCHSAGRQMNDPRNGRISLHDHPGYDLPFKIAGYFRDVKLLAMDYTEIRGLRVDE
jgi:hypothetical protein